MDAREAYEIRTDKGIHLQKLAVWTKRELREAEDDEDLERTMKGFAICVVGAILFPSTDSVLEPDQLGAVCAIWEGERLGPAVLAFLYSGLTASSLANRAPQLKTRMDWREYLRDVSEEVFNVVSTPFSNRDLRSRLAPGVDLHLIGASEFVLYNPHRCLPQLDFARRYVDWKHGGQLVESDAPDSIAYLRRFQEEYGHRDFMRPERNGRNTLFDQLRGQLASTEVQLIEARTALETLRAAQLTGERADTAGASSSRGAPAPEVASLQQQLSTVVERARRAEHDLLARSEELRDAQARETDTAAELTQLRSQLTRREPELPREVAELQALLSLERRDLERQQARWGVGAEPLGVGAP
ncbi:hypothetical protein Taro_023573 [Colocasia esculenta]|uniref:Uncharacterized protein n=1 Tax=Colocasia esculenta TaxID=4460 RepID=A0A843UXT1_COLES|nr:hypothetical protein [Colocasia esculenta]